MLEGNGREAFIYAHEVLTWLQAQGITAYAELFEDGSGCLVMRRSEAKKMTPEVSQEVTRRLHSVRWMTMDDDDPYVRLSSCQGWHP